MSETNNNIKQSVIDFEAKKALRMNDTLGNLNAFDGIDCPKCKNKGYVYFTDDKHPFMTMKQCECMTKRKSVQYAKSSGLKHLLDKRLNDYNVTAPWQGILKSSCASYIMENCQEWLVILGQSGCGKTHLASSVSNSFIQKGVEVRYCVWPDTMKQIKSEMFDESHGNQNSTFEKIKVVPVLYIDDLFKGKISETDRTITYEIINYRYNNRLTTLITSELTISQMVGIDEAIAGRIREMSKKYLLEINYDKSKNYRFKNTN